MKNQRNLIPFLGLLLIYTVYSRAAETGSCKLEKGICIEPITNPLTLSEGPHWDDEAGVLYFVDITSQRFFCYDPTTGNLTSTYIKNGPLGVAIPVAGEKNKFIAGAGTDFIKFTWDPSSNTSDPDITVLATVDEDRNGTRFNDGKIDPSGRFWGGTMDLKMMSKTGSLYEIDSDFNPRRVITSVTISNGLAWSHDSKTFYYIDSPTEQVVAYDYDQPTASISNKRVLFDFTKNNVSGVPDGMTIDIADNLWVATYGGGKVLCVDGKTGKLLRTVDIPATQVTSVAFGGPEHDVLYVTSARQGLSDEALKTQPQAGSVFSIKGLGVSGKPMLSFKF